MGTFQKRFPSLECGSDVAGLTLSGASRQLPQRGSHWRAGGGHANRAKLMLCGNGSAPLSRFTAAANEDRAWHFYVILGPSKQHGLPDMPMAPPLGELASSEAQMTERVSALTKSPRFQKKQGPWLVGADLQFNLPGTASPRWPCPRHRRRSGRCGAGTAGQRRRSWPRTCRRSGSSRPGH